MSTYYLNGKALKKESHKKLKDAFYEKILVDCHLAHGRNSYVKNEIYYTQI